VRLKETSIFNNNKIMKLKTLLTELINEVSIDQLQTQFVDTGKIEQSIFDSIKNATQKGAYATWLVKKVVDGTIKAEDISKYKKYFSIFDKNKRQYPSPDINTYGKQNSIADFIRTSVKIADEIASDPSKAKVKIGEIDGFTVYKIPKGSTELKGVSCELGSGTEWCTADSRASYFEQYIKDGPLYIFDNGKGEKYQFHFESGQFMDKNDTSVI
jgi:hypothetical protein